MNKTVTQKRVAINEIHRCDILRITLFTDLAFTIHCNI